MTDAGSSSIETLVERLASKNMVQRTTARRDLVRIGEPAIGALVAALRHPAKRMRWEAAKTLQAIADPASIPGLVESLQDPDRDVRWVVGVALIAIGRKSIIPVLNALLVDPDNAHGLYQTAHQVLHALADESSRPILDPVLHALKHGEPEVVTPLAARIAIKSLTPDS